MFSFSKNNKKALNIKEVAEKQLDENIEVIKSLRDYDEGKKDISTSKLEGRLPRVRVTSKA